MIKVSAPGNVFLFGEHSVVYERPAMLAAINLRTYTDIKKRNDGRIKLKSEGYGEIDSELGELSKKEYTSYRDYQDSMGPLRDLIGKYLRSVSPPDKGFEIEITSDIPRDSGGMSSSTAVLCSLFYGLNQLYGTDINDRKYFMHLYPIQVRVHGGSASGAEITSSSMGGYNQFRLNKSRTGANFDFENLGQHSYDLVIGDTGISASTKRAVQLVKKNWRENREEYDRKFDEIARIALQGRTALVEGDVERIGELMNRNQKILRSLEVSHPKLEELIQAALENGAHGAKLSGGGKGGIMIAICDEETSEDVAEAINDVGGKAIRTEIGVEGVRKE